MTIDIYTNPNGTHGLLIDGEDYDPSNPQHRDALDIIASGNFEVFDGVTEFDE